MVVNTLQQNLGSALKMGHMLPEKFDENLCLFHTEYHGAPREPILLLLYLYMYVLRVATFLIKLEQVSPVGLHSFSLFLLLLGVHLEQLLFALTRGCGDLPLP